MLAIILDGEVMLPLLGSVVAGGLIGSEREVHGKPAGLRTHMLVCFSSALMTAVALQMDVWTRDLPPGTQIVSDMSRMPHAILTGIGFLGAGVIFREGVSVQGLTTAASLWATAAIGITFGTGMMGLAVLSTAIALAILVILRIARYLAPPRPRLVLEVTVDAASGMDGARLVEVLAAQGMKPDMPTISWERSAELRHYRMLAAAENDDFDVEALAMALYAEPLVREVRLAPIGNDVRPA